MIKPLLLGAFTMQLCVIDDLIKQSADQIAQSEPCTNLQRVIKTLM